MAYNFLTCSGFDSSFFGDCGMVYLVIALLVYLGLIARKWIGEFVEFNLIFAYILAFVPYLLIITFTGSVKWSLLVAIVGMFIGGFFGGQLLGGSEGGEYGFD